MTALNLFPARVRFVNQDGTLTPEAYRALQIVFGRVGGALGDNGADVMASFAPVAGDLPDGGGYTPMIVQTGGDTRGNTLYPDIVQPTTGGTVDNLVLKRGTAGAPSLSFEGNSNTGIYSPGLNQFSIAVNGAQQLVVNATNFELLGHLKVESVTSTGATGTNKIVFDTSPTLVTPALGTPSALVGTNITGTAAGLTAGALIAGSGFTGTVTPVTSITVSNGLVTAAS